MNASTNLLRDSAPAPKPTFYTVPAGAQSTKCRGATCGATIYFIRSPKTGRPLPVHCVVEGGERPSDTADPSQLDMLAGEAAVHHGRGVSHFTDCPDVDQFTRGAR